MEQKKLCEVELTEEEENYALNKMENSKIPCNDSLTEEFKRPERG